MYTFSVVICTTFINSMQTLKNLRQEYSLNMEHVATLLWTTRQTYSRIEKWEKELQLGQAVILAEQFNCSVNDFLDTNNAPSTVEFNRDKFEQIIKYFIEIWSRSNHISIPKTKLAKLCYLLDFSWFYDNQHSVTWLEYRRIQFWPVSDTFFTAIETLSDSWSISVQQRNWAQLIKNTTPSQRSLLSTNEQKRMEEIASKRKNASTQQIVAFTHSQLPRLLCEDKSIIPYDLIIQEDPDHVF